MAISKSKILWESIVLNSLIIVVVQLLSHVRLFCDLMDCGPQRSCPWDFLGKNTGVGCCFLLQGIFPTQGSKPCVCIGRRILYH